MKKAKVIENSIVTIGIPVMPQRENYIDQCLQGVVAQSYLDKYEIIIAQHPGFNYEIKLINIPEHISLKLLHSGKTLSNKRNDIIVHASGKYIINIDDDVVPEHDWLENMLNAAVQNNYDIFWGLARPIYEKEFPDNLEPFEMLIGGFHFDRKGNLRRKGLIGCNFGFNKGLEHKRGKFVENMGRGGSATQDGEETLFLAESINPKMGLVKNGIVNHYVQSERINFGYVIKNRRSNVKADVFINQIVGKSNLRFLIDRFASFVKAFIPKKYFLKIILLESVLLTTAIITIINIGLFPKKVSHRAIA